MKITKKGRAWIATDTTAEDRVRLRAQGFWFHARNCAREDCAACEAKVPGAAWYSFSAYGARNMGHKAQEDARTELERICASVVASREAVAQHEIPCPEGLEYHPFQKAGIVYALEHPRCIVGDEMGLGKTIQTLGLANLIDCKRILIVCPARLRINWLRECKRWLMRDHRYYLAEKTDPVPNWFSLVVTNYEKCIAPYHLDSLVTQTWDLIVFDEAHYLKNPAAKRTQTTLKGARLAIPTNLDSWRLLPQGEKPEDCEIKRLPALTDRAERVLYLSGTPLDNDPMEIQTLASDCAPEEFGNRAEFERRYKAGCYNRDGVWDAKGASNLPELQYRLRAHCMVRRLKRDVLTELPAKVRQIVPLPTNGAGQLIAEERSTWHEHAEQLYELAASAELARAYGNEESYKTNVQALSTARMEAFSALAKIRHDLARKKVPQVLEHAKEAITNVGKIIIMGHHRDVLESLHESIPKSVLFYGGMTMEESEEARRRFMEDESCTCFIGSMMAAGLGLTLTATNTMLFCELSWVPKDIRQSEDRIHRIGQEHSVLIQHLVYEDSLDAVMAQRLVEKMEMAEQALDRPDAEQERELGLIDEDHVHVGEANRELTPEHLVAALRAIHKLAGQPTDLHPVDARIALSLARLREPGALTEGQALLGLSLARRYLRGSHEDQIAATYFEGEASAAHDPPPDAIPTLPGAPGGELQATQVNSTSEG